MKKEGKDFFFLDCRSPEEYEQMRIADANLIPLGEVRNKLSEIPKDKPVICFCKISLRGYEAALILQNAGYKDVKVMDGGVLMWPYEREI
jgi:rhodanese-related sulfurtransferase